MARSAACTHAGVARGRRLAVVSRNLFSTSGKGPSLSEHDRRVELPQSGQGDISQRRPSRTTGRRVRTAAVWRIKHSPVFHREQTQTRPSPRHSSGASQQAPHCRGRRSRTSDSFSRMIELSAAACHSHPPEQRQRARLRRPRFHHLDRALPCQFLSRPDTKRGVARPAAGDARVLQLWCSSPSFRRIFERRNIVADQHPHWPLWRLAELDQAPSLPICSVARRDEQGLWLLSNKRSSVRWPRNSTFVVIFQAIDPPRGYGRD